MDQTHLVLQIFGSLVADKGLEFVVPFPIRKLMKMKIKIPIWLENNKSNKTHKE